jgi:hypothetical protein
MDTHGSSREVESGAPGAPLLRLAWTNPSWRPRTRVDLALAIQRHLNGADGMSREEFLALYSGRRARLALALVPLG